MGKQFDILVIDDEQVVVDAITKVCSAASWLVDSAHDADVGLRKLDRNTYRMIICDILMPGVDGFEFLNQLSVKRIHTPTILTTGFSTVENAAKALSSSAIDYLPKPFSEEELISTVRRGLNYARITTMPSSDPETVAYVSCPARYYRLGYSTWASLEHDGSLKIGVTDLFLRAVGRVARVELLAAKQEITQGNVCAHIADEDQLLHSVLSPVTGNIIQQNAAIQEDPDLIQKDPYLRGWLYATIPSDLEYELRHLTPCS